MRSAIALAALAALGLLGAGCDPLPPVAACNAANEPTPAAATVCARLESIGCGIGGAQACNEAYADWQRRVPPAEFNRLTTCYLRATTCDQVEGCARSCGADGGAVLVNGGGGDAGGDTGSEDAGADVVGDAAADVAEDVAADVGSDAAGDASEDAGAGDAGAGDAAAE